jgi:hypothetical protein
MYAFYMIHLSRRASFPITLESSCQGHASGGTFPHRLHRGPANLFVGPLDGIRGPSGYTDMTPGGVERGLVSKNSYC